MAATSAGLQTQPPQHQQQQQQQQSATNVVQQKLNGSNTNLLLNGGLGGGIMRNTQIPQQQPPQIHNLQQQQQLMQQYAMKQQQHANFLQHQQQPQQQQQLHHQQQSNQTFLMQQTPSQQQQQQQIYQISQQTQQQQQMFHSQNNQFASNMMPCQNFMTPPPQLHSQPNRFAMTNNSNNSTANNTISVSSNTITWSQQYQNLQNSRKQPTIVATNHHKQPPSPATQTRPSKQPPYQQQQQQQLATSNNQSTTNPTNNDSGNQLQMLQQQQQVVPPVNMQQQPQQQLRQEALQNIVAAVAPKPVLPTQTLTPKSEPNEVQINIVASDNARQIQVTSGPIVANKINNNNNNSSCDLSKNLPKETTLTNGLTATAPNESSQLDAKPNIAPGWQRQSNNNNEIVYISPTGVTLRSPFQIKDYLLTSGTCKCGLPCPLRPEYFFNFNVQVPNTPLMAATTTVYQNNNGFNNSSSLSSSSHTATVTTITSNSFSLSSASSSSSSSATTATASSSSLPASNTSSPSSVPNALASSTSLAATTVPSGAAPTATLDTVTATIPSATPSSSLTCLHQRRFLDCQQLHAQPTELFNKDVKRRRLAANSDSASMSDSNSCFDDMPSATIDSDSMFASTSSAAATRHHCTSQNYKMMPPSCTMEHHHHHPHNHHQHHQCGGGHQQQVQSQQHLHHRHHHHHTPPQQQHPHHQHQQRPQPVITNCYNNNNMMAMENSSRPWCKDNGIMSTGAHHQHETDNGVVPWSQQNNKTMSEGNICPHRQHHHHQQQDQRHHHHQQPQHHHCSEFNNNEEQKPCHFKDDLNGYLQQQTEMVHNSLVDVQQQRHHHHHRGHGYDHSDDDDGEEDEDEEDDDLASGINEEDNDYEENDENDEAEDNPMDNMEDHDDNDEEDRDVDDDDPETEDMLHLKTTQHCLDFLQGDLGMDLGVGEDRHSHANDDGRQIKSETFTEAEEANIEDVNMEPTKHEEDHDNDDEAEEEEDDEEGDEEGEEEDDDEEEGENSEDLGDAMASHTQPMEQTVIEPTPHPVETRLLNNQSINTGFYQITAARQEDNKQNENPLSNLPRLSAISLSYDIKTNQNQTLATVNIPQPQESPLMPCPTSKASIKFVPTAQESPVSSSTLGGPRSTPDLQRATKEASKKPEQVGAISTSNESPRSCTPSPASNMEVGNNGSKPTILSGRTSASPMPSPRPQSAGRPSQQQTKNQLQQVKVQTCQKSPVRIVRQVKNVNQIQTSQQQRIFNNNNNNNNNRATLTTIAGNRGMATTTTSAAAAAGQRNVATNPTVTPMGQKLHTTMQKFVSSNNNTNTTAATTTTIPISQLQLQPLLRAANDTGGNSQIIMTSTGQIIVMPSSNNKTHLQAVPQQQAPQPTQQHQQQLIIASGNATATSQTPTNLIIQQSGGDVLNNAGQLTATLQQQPNGSYIVSQPAAATAAANNTTQLQPTTVILNPGQNILTGNTAKVLTATNNPGANIIHATGTQSILTAGNQLLTAQTAGNATNVLGQQTVVLNPLPNGGYVIQPQQTAQPAATQPTQQFATLDSQVVSQIVQQADGTQRIIISSPADLKRRTKKRKTSPTPNTQITNQTATILQPHTLNIQTAAAAPPAPHTTAQPQVVQLTATTPTAAAAATAANAFPQQFQLGSAGIQGIVVSKPATATTNTQPQQIILQNGQIIQPMNLLGQQLILPTTGLVMGPDSTLLQIQNVNGCAPTANILTAPQATTTMMLRATSPQTSKSFISSTATGQQFIVGSNGQLSPIGQIYSTPMGLMMPATTQHHTTTPTATFVQHNGTTIQLHHHHHQHQQQHQHPVTATAHQLNATTTTTHHQHQVTLQALQTHQQNLNQVINNPVGIVLETAASSTSATASPNLQTSTAGSSRSSSSAASPPDTTTHSPRSPERPPSHRSGGSDMVQCVSSSEPDGGNVSPMSSDSRQSPSTTVCDKGIVMSTAYQQNANIFKPSEAKIRRVQTPPQYHVIAGGGVSGATTTVTASTTNIAGLTNLTLHHHHQHTLASNNSQTLQQKHMDIKPDTHDSPQNSPTTTVMLTPPPPRTPTPLQQQQILQQQHQQQHQQLQQYHPQQQNFLQNSSTISVSENRLQHQSQQQLQHNHKTPTKQTQRNRNRSLKPLSPLTTHTKVTGADAEEAVTAGGSGCGGGATAGGVPISPSASSTPPLAMSLMRTFAVGELIWGPARGFPAWPGKVVKIPDNQQESVWVQWFGGGGRSNTEIMPTNILQSLSEGLEAHHKAQKDTRKSRKLNSQLEKAIQEAMTELDRISATSSTNTNSNNNNSRQQPTSSTQHQNSPNRANKRPIPRTGGYDLIAGLVNNNNYNNNSNNNNNHNYTSSNTISTTTGSTNRTKPIRIAPAPPPPSASASSPMKTNAISGGGLAATSVATTSSSVTASNK